MINKTIQDGFAVVCTTNNCCYCFCKGKANAEKFYNRRMHEGNGSNWQIWKVKNRQLTEKIK